MKSASVRLCVSTFLRTFCEICTLYIENTKVDKLMGRAPFIRNYRDVRRIAINATVNDGAK